MTLQNFHLRRGCIVRNVDYAASVTYKTSFAPGVHITKFRLRTGGDVKNTVIIPWKGKFCTVYPVYVLRHSFFASSLVFAVTFETESVRQC